MAKMKPVKRRETPNNEFDTYRQTGVFAKRVNGVVVGYFVGWRQGWDNGRARNIRAGQFFQTPENATRWRDEMEKRRTTEGPFVVDEQIA